MENSKYNILCYYDNNKKLREFKLSYQEEEFNKYIESISDLHLEDKYVDIPYLASNKNIKTTINSTEDLISYLKSTFNEKYIELYELHNLVLSNESKMRTPQTIITIHDLFNVMSYEEIKTDYSIYNYRSMREFYNNGRNNEILDYLKKSNIALKNTEALNSLDINIEYRLKENNKKLVK